MKPIVKLVRAIALEAGDHFFSKDRREWVVVEVERVGRNKTAAEVLSKLSSNGQICTSVRCDKNALVYKIVGWKSAPSRVVGGPVAASGFSFMAGGELVRCGVIPQPVNPAPTETMRLKKELAETQNALEGSEQVRKQQVEEINELAMKLQDTEAMRLKDKLADTQMTVNELAMKLQDTETLLGSAKLTIRSLREECALKADAIDKLSAQLAEKAKGNAALNSTVCGLRRKNIAIAEDRDVARGEYDRLRTAMDDITQRLEDYRDGE